MAPHPTEGEFLDVGRCLAPSVEVPQPLTTQFGTLRVELESHEMQSVADSLSRVAERYPDSPLRAGMKTLHSSGFVPNLRRLMSISPNALSGWATLMGTFANTWTSRTTERSRGGVGGGRVRLPPYIVEMIALTAKFLLTNFMDTAVQTSIEFPEQSKH